MAYEDGFNQFNVFRDICYGKAIDEYTRQNFEYFRVQPLLSMVDAQDIADQAVRTNTHAFFKLPSHTQCDALAALSYKFKFPKWKRGKKAKAAKNESVEKACDLYHMSKSAVESCVANKTIDLTKSDELWERLNGN